jgi:hypothetical protein
MIFETIRNWFGWRRKIPDPFPNAMKMTVEIPRGVTHVTYMVEGAGGAGGSGGSGGSGGGRGGDPIVVKYHDSMMWKYHDLMMWPADDDSG